VQVGYRENDGCEDTSWQVLKRFKQDNRTSRMMAAKVNCASWLRKDPNAASVSGGNSTV
jgi:hypothetical protein